MKYLLNCEGVGALIDMPRDKPSEYWGAVQKAFIKASGHDPEDRFAWCDMIHLWPDHNVGGVTYDWELAGSSGASFRLHRLPDHTDEQIDAAKAKLRRERDVVRMSVLRVKKLIEFTLP